MAKYSIQISTFVFLLMIGCTTVPSVRVSQPWIRTLKADQTIDPTKTIKIEVSGSTSPLLGSEQLTCERVQATLTQLIRRRGFTIANGSYDYLAKLYYKTDRSDRMRLSSSVSSTNSQTFAISTSSGADATSGLGVSIARAIGILTSRSSAVANQAVDQILSYTHTISVEISNRQGAILWKGESTWDSEELNLVSRITPALQLILSDLPSDKTIRPEIPEVKDTHVKNYYRLECKDVRFTCPALPYRIMFEENGSDPSYVISIPSGIMDQNAFAAYVDLIQTAEYALPNGDENDWKDPLDVTLWKKVTLGGQYFLGPKKTPVNILIELTGKSDGYYISLCKIATEKEFSDFNGKILRWRDILSDYYDYYQN